MDTDEKIPSQPSAGAASRLPFPRAPLTPQDWGERGAEEGGGGGIHIGNITGSTGVVVVQGDRAQIQQQIGAQPQAIAETFARLYQALQAQPDTPKKSLAEQAIKGLEAEAKKGEQANPDAVAEWFTGLMAMLPDIGEVAIQTFINPIAGLSTAFQKIAKKAKESLEAKK